MTRIEGHGTRPDKDTAARAVCIASGDVEPDQLHDARRAGVDVQHTALARGTGLRIQHDRACHRSLDDDAPGDAELGAEVVGAGGKDNVADGCVGECNVQAVDSAHRGQQRTAVAGQMLHGVQPGNIVVAGLGAGQHGARERRRQQGRLRRRTRRQRHGWAQRLRLKRGPRRRRG